MEDPEARKEVEKIISSAQSSTDIIFESTTENIKEFVKGKSLDDLIKLYFYITTSDILDRPPTELEEEFITEFFSIKGWVDYVQSKKFPERYSLIRFVPVFDLPLITTVFSFEVLKLVDLSRRRNTRSKNKLTKVKEDLEIALDNSYHDDVFDKVDGFSNLYETLIKHKLVKERED